VVNLEVFTNELLSEVLILQKRATTQFKEETQKYVDMKFLMMKNPKKSKLFNHLSTYQTERILLGFIRCHKSFEKRQSQKTDFNQKLAEQALSSVIIRFS
jgi:hypothetical protein